MRPLSSLLLLSSFTLAACSAPTTVATTIPAPAPRPAAPAAPAPAASTATSTYVPAVALTTPPGNWHLLDQTTDRIPGISLDRAYRELLAGKTPRRTVTVAIIDSGVDTAHVELRPNLWTNPKETPGNKVDDDGNGYVDDVHGWDFIGGASGDIDDDTFEITREYARCHGKAAAGGVPPITDTARCTQIDSAFEAKRSEISRAVENYREADNILKQIIPLLKQAANTDSLTPERVQRINPTNPQVARARMIFLQLDAQGATPEKISEGLRSLESQLSKGLNPDFNPRGIVGDNYPNPNERRYGNNDVMGPDAKHGTHVAGIIGALRDSAGVSGIAPAVKLMIIRTVPNGDERDKDVANAIRYAVDNGAQIISMSFGKSESPFKSAVDDAVRYADSKGVLMVHAAGNDGADLAKAKNYPNPYYLSGGRAANWIEVGASSWKGGDDLAAPQFSNYGKQQVDIFAPGVDIYSTIPGNRYERDSGTSMAAPVVTGVAALLMNYFPSLTASDVRRIILESASRHTDQMVIKPGTDADKVPFGQLSVTGGIVNAYNAVKMAEQMTASRATP